MDDDHFVPPKDSGDLRTSHHLMEGGGGGPSAPSKSRTIPSESAALNEFPSLILFDEFAEQANVLYYISKSLHLLEHPYRPTPVASGCSSASTSASSHLPHPGADVYNSPSTSNPTSNHATPAHRLDISTDEACSMRPVEQLTLNP